MRVRGGVLTQLWMWRKQRARLLEHMGSFVGGSAEKYKEII